MTAATMAGSGCELVVRDVDGEARILDTDLGARLGYAQPDNIRKLIRRHEASLAKLGILSTMEKMPPEKAGRPGKVYYLNRRQAVFITARCDTPTATDITVEVVQRFDDYERGAQPGPAPVAFDLNDNAHLLALTSQISAALLVEREKAALLTVEKAAADARVVEVEAKVADLEPKAETYDRLAGAEGLISIRIAAKELGWGPNDLRDHLLNGIRWMYRDGRGRLVAYQKPTVDKGWMKHRAHAIKRTDGDVLVDHPYLTPAGLVLLASKLAQHNKAGGMS